MHAGEDLGATTAVPMITLCAHERTDMLDAAAIAAYEWPVTKHRAVKCNRDCCKAENTVKCSLKGTPACNADQYGAYGLRGLTNVFVLLGPNPSRLNTAEQR